MRFLKFITANKFNLVDVMVIVAAFSASTFLNWLAALGVYVACIVLSITTELIAGHDANSAAASGTLTDAMELTRLRKQEAIAARLATELRGVINSAGSVCLPLGTIGSARYALAAWDKEKREAEG